MFIGVTLYQGISTRESNIWSNY